MGASPDGRYSQTPLADGGMSPVYGRDEHGPTAVLKSVSRLDKSWTTNGGDVYKRQALCQVGHFT